MHNLAQNHRLLVGITVALVVAAIVALIVVYGGGGQTGGAY
jgi:hypothetical protein